MNYIQGHPKFGNLQYTKLLPHYIFLITKSSLRSKFTLLNIFFNIQVKAVESQKILNNQNWNSADSFNAVNTSQVNWVHKD